MEYKIINDESLIVEILEHLKSTGIKHQDMINSGWTLISEEDLDEELNLTIESTPEKKSRMDGKTYAIRYKYSGPRDDKNRSFCAKVLDLDYIYRKEDIGLMSTSSENKEFAQKKNYSVFRYKGSYGCRHVWKRLIYAKVDGEVQDYEKSDGRGIPLTEEEKQATSLNLNDLINLKNNLKNMIVAKIKFIKGTSISRMSLVENPAVQVDFVKLYRQELKLKVNLDKQEILGPALIPNKYYARGPEFFKAYGYDIQEGGYIYFDDFTVREIATEYLNDTDLDVNTNHEVKVNKDNYNLLSSWIIESDNDLAYDYFSKEDCPVGTWMLKYKILDSTLWKNIKDGKFNGFSMEGSPDIIIVNDEVKMSEEFINDVMNDDVIDEITLDLITDSLFDVIKNNIKKIK